MGRRWWFAGLCLLGACSGGVADTSVEDSSSSDASSQSTETGSSESEATGASDLFPASGLWRWEAYGEVLDDCAIYSTPWNVGITRISAFADDGFALQPWGGGAMTPCLVETDGTFGCDPLPSVGVSPFPAPVSMTLDFNGSWQSASAGSLAFWTSAECEGAECGAIATDAGITFPCNSTALMQGSLMAEVELADEGCAAESGLVSVPNTDQTVLTIVNDSPDEVQVYWVDYTGNRVDHGSLAPGASALKWTYLGNPWLVTGADGSEQCRGIYWPTEDHGLVTLQ